MASIDLAPRATLFSGARNGANDVRSSPGGCPPGYRLDRRYTGTKPTWLLPREWPSFSSPVLATTLLSCRPRARVERFRGGLGARTGHTSKASTIYLCAVSGVAEVVCHETNAHG